MFFVSKQVPKQWPESQSDRVCETRHPKQGNRDEVNGLLILIDGSQTMNDLLRVITVTYGYVFLDSPAH